MLIYKNNKQAVFGAAISIAALFVIFLNSIQVKQEKVQHYSFPEYNISAKAPIQYYSFPERQIYPHN